MNEHNEQEKNIIDDFYMSDDSELIVKHIIQTRSDILDDEIKVRVKQLKELQKIVIFFIVAFTAILIYIALKGFFNV